MQTTAGKMRRLAKTADGTDAQCKSANWALRRAVNLQILEAKPLARMDWLTHGFSTRRRGASKLDGSTDGRRKAETSLNLAFADGDSRERVAQNRQEFWAALDAGSMRVATLRQIHSDLVHRVDANTSVRPAPQGDALITQERGVLLVVQTADCVPVLLVDTNNRGIAAIHSGWRGTLRRITEKTLGRMRMDFGTRPDDVIAAVGPAIGRCCYEVGSDVAKEFAAQFPGAREWFDGPFDALATGENDPNWLPWLTMQPPGHPLPAPKVRLDLSAANRSILAGAGVPVAQIFCSDFCTACRTDLFFSYRREGATGRMMAAIGIG